MKAEIYRPVSRIREELALRTYLREAADRPSPEPPDADRSEKRVSDS